jgi:chemotaxis protein CheD
MADIMVRMAEMAVSTSGDDVLVSLGLGSCIGLALLAPGTTVAGLAHIVLPDSRDAAAGAEARFADTAVPALVAQLARLGVARSRLTAVLVGGAQMFAFAASSGGQLDIGVRNERGVREALAAAGIPVKVAVTGGSSGRTIRVRAAEGVVTCKEAGKPEQIIFPGAAAPATLRKAA